MTPAAPGPLVSAVEVTVDGQALDPAVATALLEVRVDLHRRLPDRCSIRIADPRLELVDTPAFPLGAAVQASFTAHDANAATLLFDGEIVALEPEFTEREAIVEVTALDRSHRLDRTRRTETWQQTTYAQVARAVAQRSGLSAGDVESAGGTVPFLQQSNETDWQLLWRLADEIGFDVTVSGRRLDFRRTSGATAGSPVELRWGERLLTFRPRVTGVQQVEEVEVRGWNPATKEAIVATASPAQRGTSIGIQRSEAVDGLGGGKTIVADRPVTTQGQAQALATGIAERLAGAFVEAEGVAVGDPRIVAGGAVEVEGVGERFGGTYALSSATHLFRSTRGYETRFAVAARPARALGELAAPARAERPWRHSVVVGLVTNNDDPQKLGRVRVSYPALGSQHEGWWARLTAPAAGDARGVLMLPRAGDEVLLAFEHDDEDHPYVIGSLWNGTAKPQQLAHVDGSLAIRSDKQIVVEAVEAISVTGDKDMTLTAKGNATVTTEPGGDGPPGNLSLTAKGEATLKSGAASKVDAGADLTLNAKSSVTLKGGGRVTIEAGGQLAIKASTLQIQASGLVQVSGAQVMLG